MTYNSSCYSGWETDYHLAVQEVYPRANIDLGCPLVSFNSYVCTGWAAGYWDGYDKKVAIRPLYNDSGLPVYEIFKDELWNLAGYEFRILVGKGTWDYDGFSIALAPREMFLKLSIGF